MYLNKLLISTNSPNAGKWLDVSIKIFNCLIGVTSLTYGQTDEHSPLQYILLEENANTNNLFSP